MTESMPRVVLDAVDTTAVSQLVLRERFGRDLGLWEQMRDCYHDDSIVRISWMKGSGPEFVSHSKEMAQRGVRANHRLGPILVTLAGDRAIHRDYRYSEHHKRYRRYHVERCALSGSRRTTRWRLATIRLRHCLSARRDCTRYSGAGS